MKKVMYTFKGAGIDMLAATKRSSMKKSIILLILFFIVLSLFSFGYGSEKNDSAVTISNDFLNDEKSCENLQSKKTFLEKYDMFLGTLLGSFLAALIAIYSIHKTNKNNHKLEIQKYNTQKQILVNQYCGILYAIHSSLKIHDKINDSLNDEIKQYLILISEKVKIQIESPFSNFQIQFMKSCQFKILDFDQFNTELLSAISNYIFLVVYINENLNLSKIFSTKVLFDNDDDFIVGIIEYFKNINKTIKTLKLEREKIKTKIVKEIASFPQNDVNFGSLNSKVSEKEK